MYSFLVVLFEVCDWDKGVLSFLHTTRLIYVRHDSFTCDMTHSCVI